VRRLFRFELVFVDCRISWSSWAQFRASEPSGKSETKLSQELGLFFVGLSLSNCLTRLSDVVTRTTILLRDLQNIQPTMLNISDEE
jgi:hypothetical protein